MKEVVFKMLDNLDEMSIDELEVYAQHLEQALILLRVCTRRLDRAMRAKGRIKEEKIEKLFVTGVPSPKAVGTP